MSKQQTYKPSGICSIEIKYEIDNNKLKNVEFTKGCPGNLKAIAALVEGMDVQTVIQKLEGITCGVKDTSCSDQLVKALKSQATMIK